MYDTDWNSPSSSFHHTSFPSKAKLSPSKVYISPYLDPPENLNSSSYCDLLKALASRILFVFTVATISVRCSSILRHCTLLAMREALLKISHSHRRQCNFWILLLDSILFKNLLQKFLQLNRADPSQSNDSAFAKMVTFTVTFHYLSKISKFPRTTIFPNTHQVCSVVQQPIELAIFASLSPTKVANLKSVYVQSILHPHTLTVSLIHESVLHLLEEYL